MTISTQNNLLKQIDKAINQANDIIDEDSPVFKDLSEFMSYSTAHFLIQGDYYEPAPKDMISKAREYSRRMEIYKKRIADKRLTQKERAKMLYGG